MGAYPSAKLGSVAGARPSGRFEETSSEVESRLDPRRVTPVTYFGWGVFYTQHTGFTSFVLFDKVTQRLIGKSTKELCMDEVHVIYILYFIHPINYLTISSCVFLFVQKDDDSIIFLKIKKIIEKSYIFQIKIDK